MTELIQLTATELDAVCGGVFDFGNIVTQTNSLNQTSLNVLSFGGETEQTAFQHNTSLIGSAVFI
jgi:hypothetical protein